MDENGPGKWSLDAGVGLGHLAIGVLPLNIIFQRLLDKKDDLQKALDCTFKFHRDVEEFYCILRDDKVASICHH